MHIHPNLVNKYLCEMPDLHTNVNIHETINSGQVFLWENHKNVWFGIDGSDVIQVKHEPFEILTLSKEPKDFFRILYQIIIAGPRGPKLGPFIEDIGKKEVADKIKRNI